MEGAGSFHRYPSSIPQVKPYLSQSQCVTLSPHWLSQTTQLSKTLHHCALCLLGL